MLAGQLLRYVNFGEGEVARMEIYEETPDTKKHLCVKKSKSRKWWNRKQLKHKKQFGEKSWILRETVVRLRTELATKRPYLSLI